MEKVTSLADIMKDDEALERWVQEGAEEFSTNEAINGLFWDALNSLLRDSYRESTDEDIRALCGMTARV